MPSTPLLIALRVQQPTGTNRANLQVTCNNESTSQSQTLNTNSDGQVIFNLGSVNFSKGWSPGDKILVYSLYLGFEQRFSFTIPASGSITIKDNSNITVGSFAAGFGMSTGILVLVAVPAAPSLRYFTAQEFYDYFDLVTKEVDSENGIDILRVIRVGQAVEIWIDSETNSKFDNNSGAYYSPTIFDFGESPEYIDARFSKQNDFFLKFPPINELTIFEISQNAEGTNDITWENLVHVQLDALDATTGWSATTDGSVTLNSTQSQINEGDGALNLVKSGATVAAVTYSKTLSSSYNFRNRDVKIDYYITANTNLASTDAVELRFGSDSTNYYSQTWDRSQIPSAAWTTLSFKRDDTGVTVTGNPEATICDYFAIVSTATTAATTIAAPDQKIDDLRLNDPNRINLDKATGRIRITDSGDYPETGKRHARATYTFGRSSVPQDIKMVAILETGMKLFGFNFLGRHIQKFSAATLPDLTSFMNFKDKVINKYKNVRILPT